MAGRRLQLERKRGRSLDILLRPIGQEEGQPDHDSASARETAPGPTEFDTMPRYCLLGLEVQTSALGREDANRTNGVCSCPEAPLRIRLGTLSTSW